MNTNQAVSATNQNTMARQGSSGGLRKLELNGKYPSNQSHSCSTVGANNAASSGLAGQGSHPFNRAGNPSSGPTQTDTQERSAPSNYMPRKPNDNMNPTVGSGLLKQQPHNLH